MLLIKISEVAYFSLRNRKVFITTKNGKDFQIDMSLDQVYKELDPMEFLRANRQIILSKSAVLDVESYGLGKLIVNLTPPTPDKVIISKEKVASFRKWANS